MDAATIRKALAERLGGHLAGDDILVNRDGVGLIIRLSPAKAAYALGIECHMIPDASRPADHPRVDGRPRLGLWLEGASERLGKRLSLNLEADTGDAQFDHKVYIHSHAPIPIVKQVLTSPESRAPALSLLEAGWSKLVIDARAGLIAARKRVGAQHESTLYEQLDQAIGHLVRLARGLPRFVGDRIWRTRVIDVAAPLVGLAILVAGAALLTWGMYAYPLEESGHTFAAAGYGLALWPIVALLVFLLARKGAEGLGTWFSCMLTLLVGLPLFASGSMLVVNGRLDQGVAEVHDALIVRKDTRSEGEKTSYYLYAKDQGTPPDAEGTEMHVGREVYEAAQVGGNVHLVIMPGRLGYPWLHSLAVLPPETPAP
jgi:hypothetical protein